MYLAAHPRARCSPRRHGGELLHHVALRVAFEFVSAADGSSHRVEIWGEGADASDKATNKALASAYKYAAFQVFCIPIAGQVDSDAETPMLGSTGKRPLVLEPVQGWGAWARDIISMIGGCETLEALARVQTTYRSELHALSSYDAAAYRRIGEAVAGAKSKLEIPIAATSASSTPEEPERVIAAPLTTARAARTPLRRPEMPIAEKGDVAAAA